MYRLPENFTGTFLVGRQLEGVFLASNQVSLHFGPGISIDVLGAFRVREVGSVGDHGRDAAMERCALIKLIERGVVSVKTENKKLLTLVFECGSMIDIVDDAENFEAFHINVNGTKLIV